MLGQNSGGYLIWIPKLYTTSMAALFAWCLMDSLTLLPKHGKVFGSQQASELFLNAVDIYGMKLDRSELAKDPKYYKRGDAVQILSMCCPQ